MIRIDALVTGEEFAFPIAEKFIVFTLLLIHNENYKSYLLSV